MKTPSEISPFNLMQEQFRNQPWKLLVSCILLNQVSAKVARPIWEELFRRYPTPESMMLENELSTADEVIAELAELFRPLGFQNRRADRIWKMTFDFLVTKEDRDPLQLHGVGKYAADSYNMFVKGELVLDVKDKELLNYVRWAKEKANGQEA